MLSAETLRLAASCRGWMLTRSRSPRRPFAKMLTTSSSLVFRHLQGRCASAGPRAGRGCALLRPGPVPRSAASPAVQQPGAGTASVPRAGLPTAALPGTAGRACPAPCAGSSVPCMAAPEAAPDAAQAVRVPGRAQASAQGEDAAAPGGHFPDRGRPAGPGVGHRAATVDHLHTRPQSCTLQRPAEPVCCSSWLAGRTPGAEEGPHPHWLQLGILLHQGCALPGSQLAATDLPAAQGSQRQRHARPKRQNLKSVIHRAGCASTKALSPDGRPS